MEFNSELISELKQDSNLDPKVYARVLKSCNNNYLRFITTLVREGYIPRFKYGRKIGDMLGFAYLPLSETLFEPNILKLIPQDIAQKHQIIALYKVGNAISVAMSDPTDIKTMNIVSNLLGEKISPVFSYSDEIQNAITMNYTTMDGLDVVLEEVEKSNLISNSISNEELTTLSQAQEIKDLLDMIIYLALKGRASDIHIEPKKHHVLLRYRHDGVLFNKAILPIEIQSALVSRIKVLSHLDITEKRKPQDGRFDFPLPQHTIDLRVSILPSLHGEKVVIRLLGTELLDQYLEFESLGFSQDIISNITKALSAPNGMLIVTGPTGSGKTTTLHTCLNHLNHPGINVVTIEDPVEYERPNITQVAVNTKVGRDFPTVLRSILRQDPDVIMVGEIRDLETAKIATNAALTGHRVLTSLHTNDAIQAVTRMVEMGVEHYSIAPSIVGVLGQRLVRKICQNCRVEYTPTTHKLMPFFDMEGVTVLPTLYYGKGCNHCNNTGFSGRIAIHEFLGVTQALRNCILRGTDYDEFFKVAMDSSEYKHFYYDGFQKALKGLTTLDEVVKVVTVVPID